MSEAKQPSQDFPLFNSSFRPSKNWQTIGGRLKNAVWQWG